MNSFAIDVCVYVRGKKNNGRGILPTVNKIQQLLEEVLNRV